MFYSACIHYTEDSLTTATGYQMLLPGLGVIGTFAFQGVVQRVCPGFRGAPLVSSSPSLLRLNRRTSSKMSTTDEKTKVVQGVRQLCDAYDGFILDQYGVLHGEFSGSFSNSISA